MMLDVMLDIETMGTKRNSIVAAIGAVAFSLHTRTLGARFYSPITLESAFDAGFVFDPDTVRWWFNRDDNVRNALVRNAKPLDLVLDAFTTYLTSLGPLNEIKMWGNGPAFDNVMVSDCYERLGKEIPWKYWNDRCFRTVAAMFPHIEKRPREGTHHHALDDAVYQAEHLIYIRETNLARKQN